MFTATRFCVKIIPRPSERPTEPELLQFYELEPAERHAEIACRRAAKVELYRVIGEPVQDLWRSPVLIATYAKAPAFRPGAPAPERRCA